MKIEGLKATIKTYLKISKEMYNLDLAINGEQDCVTTYYKGKIDDFKMILAEIEEG